MAPQNGAFSVPDPVLKGQLKAKVSRSW